MKLLSCVRLFATPWTIAYHVPPSMGFSRQEYWSGVPLPSPKRSNRGVKNKIKKLKYDNSKNISRTFSGVLVGSVGLVDLLIVPWSGLYFSRSIGPFLCSRY